MNENKESTESNETKENTKRRAEVPVKQNKPVNGWKVAFILLAAVLLGTAGFLSTRIFSVRETYKPVQTASQRGDMPAFSVDLNKEQVNRVISHYLNDFLKDSGVQYSFVLADQAMLSGTFKLLGHDTKFYLYFEPFVLTNGNVQLRATSLSVGTLSLPISAIMKYIMNSIDVPPWIEVLPEEQLVNLHLDEFEMQSGMFLRADKINLVDDEIRLSVFLPIQDEKEK
ncbi:YpmS family protein [Vagococcus acidifermentans]|uniref:DUF2140 domain-containing protein n=1 Tax=Vagococcus acidifermentans TaxID=564710 RepID=A0A430AY16_9ENTE|nr:YpmS family protein [Vagococcus acidifermentans]RSU12938.1 hypothetical protein CBF27_05210 [Vagococcus acidifermentans]